MKKITLILFLVVSSFLCSVAQTPAKATKYSPKEIKEDFKYLYTTLQLSHYNLFVNTNKHDFDEAFEKITSAIRDSLTFIEANRIFQPFLAMSGLAHCSSYPFSPAYVTYASDKGTLFPFNITVHDKKMWVSQVYTNDSLIAVGDEILQINGKSAVERLSGIYRYLSGENEYLKNTLIDLFHISRVYWLVYGKEDQFELKIKKTDGQILTRTIRPISVDQFEDAVAKEIPVFNPKREFKVIDKIAYLHPGAFSNAEGNGNTSELKTFEKGEFMTFLDAAFKRIRSSGVNSLIIDLRGNPGGDNSFSDAMLAYFAPKPFSFCSRFSVKTSAITKAFWKDVQDSSLIDLKRQILENPDGTVFEAAIIKQQPKPDSIRFKGKVCVLIDRYSYSNAVTTAATIQDYHMGILIGEHTADVPTTYASIHEFNLPHTHMAISYPKAFMVRPNGDDSLHVLQPDLVLKDSDDWIAAAKKYIEE